MVFERMGCMKDFFKGRHLMMQQMQPETHGSGQVILGDYSEWSAN